MMVRVSADIPATSEARQRGVLFQHQHQNQHPVVTLQGTESWKPHENALPCEFWPCTLLYLLENTKHRLYRGPLLQA